MVLQMILITFLLVSLLLVAYNRSDNAKLKADFHTLQFRVHILSNKTSILEQYIDEIWKEIPQQVFSQLQDLQDIRDSLIGELGAIQGFINSGRLVESGVLLSGRLEDTSWERRTHKLVLSLCKELTLDATLARNNDDANIRQYKRKPTLLSLKEIAELLREERSIRC